MISNIFNIKRLIQIFSLSYQKEFQENVIVIEHLVKSIFIIQ